MNCNNNLILANGQDKTPDIFSCQYNNSTHKYDVTYQSGKQYSYNHNSIEWVRDPEVLNPAFMHVAHGNRELLNIHSIFVFHARSEDYWHICFTNGNGHTYPRRELKESISCLSEKKSLNRLEYLKQLATINELKSEDGIILLKKQYEKLDFVDRNSTMANYLNPNEHTIEVYKKSCPIFPFGGNASQFQAVRSALENQISVIQGPPGTGKTQKILNIIANLLVDGKTVLVVSNNNSATENVVEKLASAKYNLGFLAAPLGNAENKNAFIQNQTGTYPDLATWHCEAEQQKSILQKAQALSTELSGVFSQQERLAKARLELASLRTEIHYFEEYCKETGRIELAVQPKRKLGSNRLMQLWQECNEFFEKDHSISFWFKIKSVLFYGISDWKFFRSDLPSIISLLQGIFYRCKEGELCAEIE